MQSGHGSTPRLLIIAALLAVVFAMTSCLRSPEEKYADFMDSGKQFMEQQDYASAVLQFRNAAQIKPDDAEAYYQAALAEVQRGNGGQAYQLSKKADQLNSEHNENQLLLAQLMVMISQQDSEFAKAAELRLQRLLDSNPANADALYLMAATKARVGDSEEMQRLLQEALSTSPQHLQSSLALARAKLREQDYEGAEQVLQKAVADAPNSVHPLLALGQLYLVLKRPEDARTQFARVLEVEPQTGQAVVGLALISEQAGDTAEAERLMQKAASLDDKRFRAFYGRLLVEHGKWDEAFAEFKRLIAEDPRNTDYRTQILSAYLRADRPGEAEAYLRQAIADEPDDRNSRKQLVGLLVALNRSAEAEQVLQEAITKNPRDSDALLQRTEIYWRSGRIQQAEQDVAKVLQARPTSHEAHFFQAKVHQARGQTRLYQQELTEAVRLDPNFLVARVELANALRAVGDGPAALSLLDDAPETSKNTLAFAIARNWTLIQTRHPDARASVDGTLKIAQTPEVLLQDGALKLDAGQLAAARAAFEAVLQQDPENVRALGALARTYTVENQQGEATEAIRKYVEAMPDSVALQNFAGAWYASTRNGAAARQAYQAALAADPNSVPARLAVAQLDLAENNNAAAREGFHAVLAINPNDVRALVYLAMAEEAEQNYDAAIAGYKKALSLNPDGQLGVIAHNNLAYRLSETHNLLDEALNHAQLAKELDPENRQIDDTLGWIYYRKGIYASALDYLESAATAPAGKTSALIQYHLAICRLKNGDAEGGRAALALAKSLDPNLPEAAMADKLLQQLAGQ